MPRFYLQPNILVSVPINGLRTEQVCAAIDDRCLEERIIIAAHEAAEILRKAGVSVDEAALARLENLVK